MLHFLISISLIAASIHFGKWNKWREFLPTIFYFSFFNMYYQYISLSFKKLWEIQKPFVSLFLTDSVYIFIAFPCLVVLFLSNIPNDTSKTKLLIYYVKWIVISFIIEWILVKLGYFQYFNGWSTFWSGFFYSLMYPLLHLHHRKPLLALGISIIVVAFYLFMFNYNVF